MSWGTEDEWRDHNRRNRAEERAEREADWQSRQRVWREAQAAYEIAYSFRESYEFFAPLDELRGLAARLRDYVGNPQNPNPHAEIIQFASSLSEEDANPMTTFGLAALVWAQQHLMEE